MSFYFNQQTRLTVGAGKLKEIGSEAKRIGGKRCLLVMDPYFVESEVVNIIESSLSDHGIKTFKFSEVQPNPRDYDCEAGRDFAKEKNVDFVVTLGGGSAMDEGKAIAALVTNGGICSDWNEKELDRPMLPVICIPTTSGTGSEVTFISVIDDTKLDFKMAFIDPINLIPKVAILDPELTVTLPKSVTSGPGMDVLTHAIEAYTVKVNNPISDCLALKAIQLVKDNLFIAYNEPTNLEARENMLIASSLAGSAFTNANVGSVHAMSETVGAIYDLPHGLLNALLLIPTMEYNIDADFKRFADVAVALGVDSHNKTEKEVAYEGLEVLKTFFKQFDLPNFEQLNKFDSSQFKDLATKAMDNPLTNDNVKQMNVEAYIQILEKSYTI